MLMLARVLELSPGWIGLLTSVAAVGGLVGSLIARRVAEVLGQGPTIWVSILASAPCAYVLPFVQRDWSLVLLAVAQMFFWTTVVVYNIAQVSFRQGLTPPALLGRMNATMRFVVWGTIPLGAFVGAGLGTWIGVRETLLVAAVGMSFAFLPVFLSPLRTMRELPTYAEAGLTDGR
jgi:predicted MFS family arabinose efflux permease